MTIFDARGLIATLPTFQADSDPPLNGEMQAFCHYYGIDFDPAICQQQLGSVRVEGFQIAIHRFRPPSTTGTAMLLHGYHDHHGLYGHLIRYLIDRGLTVICFDLPGHGLSSGDRGSISDFCHYQQVFTEIFERTLQSEPGPLHLLGQSTGAAIINQFLLSRRPSLEGRIVLLAPLVRPARWPFVSTAHSLLRPLIKAIPRQFSHNSNDPEFLRFISEQDTLQGRTITVEWVGAMKRWISEFIHLPAAEQYAPLIIQGQRDETVDWQYNLTVMQDKFPAAEILMLADARHHLVNETAEIRQRYLQWLDQQWPLSPQGR